jgi:hypothetical protein
MADPSDHSEQVGSKMRADGWRGRRCGLKCSHALGLLVSGAFAPGVGAKRDSDKIVKAMRWKQQIRGGATGTAHNLES